MARITYIEFGGRKKSFNVKNGRSIMEGARDNGVEGIDADCGGSCICSTCHVYLEMQWIGRVPPPARAELETLDFATDVDPIRSRLSCQILVSDSLDGLIVHIPASQT